MCQTSAAIGKEALPFLGSSAPNLWLSGISPSPLGHYPLDGRWNAGMGREAHHLHLSKLKGCIKPKILI